MYTSRCAKGMVRRQFNLILWMYLNTSNLLARRDLEPEQKKNYITAVKCLTTTPASPSKETTADGPPGMSLFDEFVLSHMESAEGIHGVVR